CRCPEHCKADREGPPRQAEGPLRLSKNLCRDESAQVGAGELEGAAARLEWDQMPRKACCARLPASEARTFVPLCGAKVTAFLQAVEKVLGLFRQPEAGGKFPPA